MKNAILAAALIASSVTAQCSQCQPAVTYTALPLAWNPPVIAQILGVRRNAMTACEFGLFPNPAFVLMSMGTATRPMPGFCGDLLLQDPWYHIELWLNPGDRETDRVAYYSTNVGPSITINTQALMCDSNGVWVFSPVRQISFRL